MRIVTWNCCRGPIDRKLAAIGPLRADVSVLQECPRPAMESAQCLWFGENPRQGIAIVASSEYTLRRHQAFVDVPSFAFPVLVSGPCEFLLLAVWAKHTPRFRYIEAVVRAVELYSDTMSENPTVLIGDLNSNRAWDAHHPSALNHSALVRLLADLQMVSVYHAFFDEEHGNESTPTFHMYRKRERPFHIDYCFAPVSWLPHLRSVELGSLDEWSAFSDHVPLLVDFECRSV